MLRHNVPSTAKKLMEEYERGKERPARVLLAEDDQEMRCILSSCLRKAGYDVFEVKDGDEFIEFLDITKLSNHLLESDIIVSDIRMPGSSGLEILSMLRSYDWKTPVILITAFGSTETHAEAMRLGASAVFDKPFDIEVFLKFIKQERPPFV